MIVVESDPPRACPVRPSVIGKITTDVLDGPLQSERDVPSDADSDDEQRPIAVTWCPICASAVVYTRAVDGRVLPFGTSGELADDALVMHDRESSSSGNNRSGRRSVDHSKGANWMSCRHP